MLRCVPGPAGGGVGRRQKPGPWTSHPGVYQSSALDSPCLCPAGLIFSSENVSSSHLPASLTLVHKALPRPHPPPHPSAHSAPATPASLPLASTSGPLHMLPSLLEHFPDTLWLSPCLLQVLPPRHHLGEAFLDHSVEQYNSPPTPHFLSLSPWYYPSDIPMSLRLPSPVSRTRRVAPAGQMGGLLPQP